MRLKRKLATALLPLALLLGGTAAEARDWSTIKADGKFLAVTEGAFFPFNYFEGSKLTGFEVEVAEAVAKKLGLAIEWRVVPFDAQVASIRQDRFDFAIASHGYTEERANRVRELLVGAGIPRDAIQVAGRGSREPQVAHRPGTQEPRNRRVEIKLR